MIAIYAHGGGCCAIRCIRNLGTEPTACLPEQSSVSNVVRSERWHRDLHGKGLGKKDNLFTCERPKEKAIERFDAAVDYIEGWRRQGLIEVVIRVGYDPDKYDPMPPDFNSQKRWIPLLRRRGFRRVNIVKNSNTHAVVHVYHKLTGQ